MRNIFKLVDGPQASMQFPFWGKCLENICYFWEIISILEGKVAEELVPDGRSRKILFQKVAHGPE